jgi:hypothetical protein
MTPDPRLLKSLALSVDTALHTATTHKLPTVSYLLSMASLAISELIEAATQPTRKRQQN